VVTVVGYVLTEAVAGSAPALTEFLRDDNRVIMVGEPNVFYSFSPLFAFSEDH